MKHRTKKASKYPIGSSGKSQSRREIHPDAAGIDIGSEVHYVAIPEDRDENPVRTFGCLTPDLHEMAKWLVSRQIKTVAMESTGVYWIPVAQILDQYDIEVKIVDASHLKNVPRRKTDVLDCKWLQELHEGGYLLGAFRPAKEIQALRTYWRGRQSLVEDASRQIQLMQKSMEQMNVQLHKVISDISGVSGMRIIRAILAGNHDPLSLAQLADRQIKSSKDTIAKALTGDYHKHHLFMLDLAVELYDTLHQQITECDKAVENYMKTLEPKPAKELPAEKPKVQTEQPEKPKRKSKAKPRKNQVHFDLQSELIRINGVDLTTIDGIDTLTAQTILTECGPNVDAFPSEKHFSSWLGLCPNNRITGGKIKRTRTRKVQNRLTTALRIAAQSLHRSQSALGAFYRRLHSRLGPCKAITAAAHKLACLVYRLLKYGKDYVDAGQAYYENHYKERLINNLKKNAKRLGFQLMEPQTGELVS